MSRRSMLNGFLSLARAWPVCLFSATIAYLTIASMSLFLASDIAELIVNGVLTFRLVLTTVVVFILLNVLLALTYAISLFIVKHEGIAEGLRKGGKRLIKGFLLLSFSSLAGLALMVLGYQAASSTSLSQDAFKLVAMSYGAGLITSILLAFPLVWLLASLAGVRLWMGLGRFLSTVFLVFLMLTIFSIYGLPGLFTDSLLIPTVISLIVRESKEVEKNEDDNRGQNQPKR
ncbi:MAG: hypothetical protein FGF50_11445 [Candidatus Brockarchaeota archaeon]|nr:hypothetical protein [Candidatus Brockarchaeota archaeon]